jgi:hypothetical protein
MRKIALAFDPRSRIGPLRSRPARQFGLASLSKSVGLGRFGFVPASIGRMSGERNDPNITVKAADVVGLRVAPPKKAIALWVDGMPSIQASEQAHGYLKLPDGRALTGQSHHYKRAWHDNAVCGSGSRHRKDQRDTFKNKVVASNLSTS